MGTPKPLSPRLMSVAELVAQGYSTKRIASELGLTQNTVEHYIRKTKERIGGEGKPRLRIIVWWHTERLSA